MQIVKNIKHKLYTFPYLNSHYDLHLTSSVQLTYLVYSS